MNLSVSGSNKQANIGNIINITNYDYTLVKMILEFGDMLFVLQWQNKSIF